VPINAEKYQQRRYQEATADTEHPGHDTDSQSQHEDTDSDISDRQIEG
jgi:hypothetical protein